MAPIKKTKNKVKATSKKGNADKAAGRASSSGPANLNRPRPSMGVLGGVTPGIPPTLHQSSAANRIATVGANPGPKKVAFAMDFDLPPHSPPNNLPRESPFLFYPPQHQQNSPDHPRQQPLAMPDHVGLFENNLERMEAQGALAVGATRDATAKYNRTAALIKILRGLRGIRVRVAAKATTVGTEQISPTLIIDNLAISKLLTATVQFPIDTTLFNGERVRNHANALEDQGCHFCVFDCDWGVSDTRVLLPADDALGTCAQDDAKNSLFFDAWINYDRGELLRNMAGDTLEEKEARLAELEELNGGPLQLPDDIDVDEEGKPLGIRFCHDCPWTQIDPKKTRICAECRHEKLAIIAHGKHRIFWDIAVIDADNYVPNQVTFHESFRTVSVFDGGPDPTWADRKDSIGTNKRCSVCTSRAFKICADCPLKLCELCESLIGSTHCGSELDKLLFHYGSERAHIRNDAFLLRSDGGGC